MAVRYRLSTGLISRSPPSVWLEGQSFTLIRDGQFELATLTQGNSGHDEFQIVQQRLNCSRCAHDQWSEALHSTRIT